MRSSACLADSKRPAGQQKCAAVSLRNPDLPNCTRGAGSPEEEPILPSLIDSAHRSKRGTLIFEPLESVQDQWRSLVRANATVSLYHSERWLAALRATYGFSFRVAMAEQDGAIDAGIMFARARRPVAPWWVSLPFSDSCPPLALTSASLAVLLAKLQQQHANERFEIRGVTIALPWQSLECFLSWSVDLSVGVPNLYRSLGSNFRRNLGKARKSGIRVEHGNSSALMARFYRLHSQGRQRLGLPCQPLRFFRTLREVFAQDLDVWIASRPGRDVATILTIADGYELYYKWAARDSRDASGAGHLLYWSMIEQSAGKFCTLNLGRSDQRNSGLNRFKQESGGHCRPLPYAFFPTAPQNPSSEVMHGKKRFLATIWRWLPAHLCRVIERYAYVYMS
jgi:hypothetical protein